MTTPSGFFAKPKDQLAELLAACPAWQTLTGADDAAEAKAKIHYLPTDVEDDKANTWPLAVITYMNGDWSAARVAINAGVGNYDISSSLTLSLERIGEKSDALLFENEVGAIVKEMMELSEPGGSYMLLSSVSLVAFAFDDEGKQKIHQAVLSITWEQ